MNRQINLANNKLSKLKKFDVRYESPLAKLRQRTHSKAITIQSEEMGPREGTCICTDWTWTKIPNKNEIFHPVIS